VIDLERYLQPTDAGSAGRKRIGAVLFVGLVAALAPLWSVAHCAEGAGGLMMLVSRQMLSFYLLPALGALLALRRGAIDLGVWMNFSLGAVVPAALMSAGAPSLGAMAMAAALAGLVGLAGGLAVARLRVPAPLATGVLALGVWLVLRRIAGGTIMLAPDAFAGWLLPIGSGSGEVVTPLAVTRGLVVTVAYGFAMICLAARQNMAGRVDESQRPRERLAGTLAASAVLASVGGSMSLLELGYAAAPQMPAGDLRIVAAVVLAGGWFLAGPGSTLLAALLLAPATWAATAMLSSWDLAAGPWALQALVVAGLALGAQVCMHRLLVTGRSPKALAAAGGLFTGGLWALGAGAYASPWAHRAAHLGAVACAAAAAALATAGWVSSRRAAGGHAG
jgi:ribose/xylose/arabinose/galactoside ABC-type transport system permease subunit